MTDATTVILDTALMTILDNGRQYLVHIALSQGGWIEHEPFPRSQEGLVAALLLAADVNAGKFYPKRILSQSPSEKVIPKQNQLIQSLRREVLKKDEEGL